WVWRSGQKELEAEESLSAVRMPFSPLESPGAGTAEALVKVAQQYPNSRAAAKAHLRAGSVYFGEGNYSKAREQFDAYLRSPSDTPWVPEAVFGVAASLDAENNVSEAVVKYKDFIERYPGDSSADQARLNLARLYEMNNQAREALELLTKIVNPGTPQPMASPSAAEAHERIRALTLKFPSLTPSNPAPAFRTDRPLVLKPEGTLPPQTPTTSIKVTTNGPNSAPPINLNPTPSPQVPVAPNPAPSPGK